ncbi:hypothetical protein HETIRDRAFT_452940 [Heterobasidion irregulare TC 32-1]|uniref:Uncharacterized protein n=1 Tax=Heterobasidion irregulare (strain TC 32-1) TaxID=747525 RepID=W4K4A9_HETIT|nr:uncharacterized protein HETIRDRAFT_452940 [Heterobasidion irregulare TC 32-1]ETW79881.1 hypothetical protein HETIRDRAFT_452940 [Heterobasidion irregulare TC 32-1]
MPERGWHVTRSAPALPAEKRAFGACVAARRSLAVFFPLHSPPSPSAGTVSKRTGGSTARAACLPRTQAREGGALHQKKNSTTSLFLSSRPSLLHAIKRPTWPNRLATDVRHPHPNRGSSLASAVGQTSKTRGRAACVFASAVLYADSGPARGESPSLEHGVDRARLARGGPPAQLRLRPRPASPPATLACLLARCPPARQTLRAQRSHPLRRSRFAPDARSEPESHADLGPSTQLARPKAAPASRRRRPPRARAAFQCPSCPTATHSFSAKRRVPRVCPWAPYLTHGVPTHASPDSRGLREAVRTAWLADGRVVHGQDKEGWGWGWG